MHGSIVCRLIFKLEQTRNRRCQRSASGRGGTSIRCGTVYRVGERHVRCPKHACSGLGNAVGASLLCWCRAEGFVKAGLYQVCLGHRGILVNWTFPARTTTDISARLYNFYRRHPQSGGASALAPKGVGIEGESTNRRSSKAAGEPLSRTKTDV